MISFIIGISVGYLFYKIIGCNSNGWSLQKNVWVYVLYGAFLGYLFLTPIVSGVIDKISNFSQEQIIPKDISEDEICD